MAKVNSFYLLNLFTLDFLFVFTIFIFYGLSSLELLYLLILVIGVNIAMVYAAGDWVNTFMEMYFIRVLFLIILLLLFTVFTDIESKRPHLAYFQKTVRDMIGGVLSLAGIESPYATSADTRDDSGNVYPVDANFTF